MLSSSCANLFVNSSFAICPAAYFSTSALLTSLRFTGACFGMPVSSAANAKIVSTDSNSFFVSASVILTSLVVSLRSLRATSPRLCPESASCPKAEKAKHARKQIAKNPRRCRHVFMSPHSGQDAVPSILPEPKPQLTAKVWFGLTEVSKRAGTMAGLLLKNGWKRGLLQVRQLLGRYLYRFRGGIVFLNLLVEALGVERLVAGLVKIRQLQLRRRLAHGNRGLADQFLVKDYGILRAVGVSVDSGQCKFGYRSQLFAAARNHRLQVAFRGCVVPSGRTGHA